MGLTGSIAFYRLPGVTRSNYKDHLSPCIGIYCPQAIRFDGKSDGKILLSVLFRNFTVKPIRGTRETLQITELLPLWIVEIGKSLSFPSTANLEASDRSKSLSPNFMAESIPRSAYHYTGAFRGKYTGNSHNCEPTPMLHLWIDSILATRLCAR